MALGGGIWTTQNKILPGAYINFISRATASAELAQRGVAAFGAPPAGLYYADNTLIEVNAEDFGRLAPKLFGRDAGHNNLKPIRDILKHSRTVYVYKMAGTGTKADCTFATAKYTGTAGNSLKIKIAANVDDDDMFDVSTILYDNVVDTQTVETAAGLVNNDYVDFKGTATLAAGTTSLTGGADGTVGAEAAQAFLDKLESTPVNAFCVDPATAGAYDALCAAWTQRMRDAVGIKVQYVGVTAADYEGVVTVPAAQSAALPWVTGVVAGAAVNASSTNMLYDGEAAVTAPYTQAQLETFIETGYFALHKVGNDLRVLTDINSLVTFTDDKGEVFRHNQTIRVIDDIAMSIAQVFNTRYLGRVPNDANGRISLWADIVRHHRELERVRAIENFDESLVTVAAGEAKGAVVVNDAVTVTNAMEQLYMTTVIS